MTHSTHMTAAMDEVDEVGIKNFVVRSREVLFVLKFRCHSRHLPISLLPKGRLPIKNYRQSSISKMDSSYYIKKYQTNVFVPLFYLFFCIYWQGFFHHQTLTFFEALTSSDDLILMSSIDHLISLFRLLLNSPLESHWIRGLKLTSKLRAVQFWVSWKKMTTKSERRTSVSSSTVWIVSF